jgi:hypothetical protein
MYLTFGFCNVHTFGTGKFRPRPEQKVGQPQNAMAIADAGK